jgi:predicted membrane-bound spermidine synthase
MSEKQNGKWGRLALINGAVAAWLIYDMMTATEVPRQTVMILQYVFLIGTLIGLAASLVKFMSQK